MLKWAVNGTRQSCLQNQDNSLQLPAKSSDLSILRPKPSWLTEENQHTSTPLQKSDSSHLRSPSHKVDCLKDLSCIVPGFFNNSPLIFHAKKDSSNPLETTESKQIFENLGNNCQSTLPTFDVEYSPSDFISGPMLALRGVGIADSYFKKPRYIAPHFEEVLLNVNEETLLETKMLENRVEPVTNYPPYGEESTLSSTKMGDVTLERMIDAIIESNRKSQKLSYSEKQSSMSPTYTPAEDPASDLQEVWDSEKVRYRQQKQKLRARLTKKILFDEIEISPPLLHENTGPGHLRRQCCLRRKRKITQITTGVVTSAQKLISKDRQPKLLRMHSNSAQDEIHTNRLRNLSPDSGHNSSSDYDEKEADITSHQCIEVDCKILDNIERKSQIFTVLP